MLLLLNKYFFHPVYDLRYNYLIYLKKRNQYLNELLWILLACNAFQYILEIYNSNDLNYILKKYSNSKDIKSLIPFIKNDKKNNDNKINFILLKKIGKTTAPNKFKMSIKNLKKNINAINQY